MNNEELIKRELERMERNRARQKEMFKAIMKKENIEVVNDGGYFYNLKYKDKVFYLLSNNDWNNWNTHYRLKIDDKTLATRCDFSTAIQKAKRYIDNI